jgi:uncharacterized protein (DUF934 family)
MGDASHDLCSYILRCGFTSFKYSFAVSVDYLYSKLKCNKCSLGD